MTIELFLEKYRKSPSIKELFTKIEQEKKAISLNKFIGSSFSFIVAEFFKQTNRSSLLLFENKEKAAYHLNDLEKILGDRKVLFYPDPYKKEYDIQNIDLTNVLMRSIVLHQLISGESCIILSYPEALFKKVINKADLKKKMLSVKVRDALSLDFISEILFEYNFEKVDFVKQPGEFAIKNDIIDVFAFNNEHPFRLEFLRNEIDSIRSFDVASQISIEYLKKIEILTNIETNFPSHRKESFLKFFPKNGIIFSSNIESIQNKLNALFEEREGHDENLSIPHRDLFLSGLELIKDIDHFQNVYIDDDDKGQYSVTGCTESQPDFDNQLHLLMKNFEKNSKKGYKNYLFCANEKQVERFRDVLKNEDHTISYEAFIFQIHEGFIDHELKIACYTDHQIFNRYHKFQIKNGFSKPKDFTLKRLENLQIGDFVTHVDHGIGKFGGLQKIEVDGKQQEAFKLIYDGENILYISIHSLHKISKFSNRDGKTPKIYKLGSGAWKKVKQTAKNKVKKIAFDLIQLYAKRKNKKGFSFASDSDLQQELEASFIYEDTPDQEKATKDVKKDMESDIPMDRLICGDVGFGKTEIAIRAAFKAVDNGKQVVVLVPTTILAFQHFKSFKKRLKNFPVNINYLNRFRSTLEKDTIHKELIKGKIDILIGTHQLVSDKVKYKDLGLLIIDEEQKFGVSVKDKMKTIKENIDTLSLTATPIPRTLQFSLMAARDLSIIATPPPNRYPIENHVIEFDREMIKKGIEYELSRGGQVFFIHNRVKDIESVAHTLQTLVPKVKIAVAHGQLNGKKLEDIMLHFVNGYYDILIASTIIENGLDIPNANTIFINKAHNFGLSDLHQMRGRVGRSNKKAFCYFIAPPREMMTKEARKRIEVLENFSEMGSGIEIAMKDLEIRGSGDLLGADQSGFINDIGFDSYQKILEEAIKELKENEFKSLYDSEKLKNTAFISEVQMETDFEILFPDTYIHAMSERLFLYKKLMMLDTENQLIEFEKKLRDQFGKIPIQVFDLFNALRIKWVSKKLGFEKIVLKQKKMISYFVSDKKNHFYDSAIFMKILNFVQNENSSCVMKEKETKDGLRLLIIFSKVDSLNIALETLNSIF